jgi:hypothetical protein
VLPCAHSSTHMTPQSQPIELRLVDASVRS